MGRRARISAAVLAVAALFTAATPAAAQNPGSNGERVWASSAGQEYRQTCLDGPTGYGFLFTGAAAFAPDGRTLAISAESSTEGPQQGRSGLFKAGLAPCSPLQFLTTSDEGSTASWSPDGSRLAVQDAGRIKVVTSAGAFVRDLGPGAEPTWDPRGTAIAFVGADGIRKVSPNGGSSKLWKRGTLAEPDWSPDGSKIAYLDRAGYPEGGRIKYASASTGGSTVTTPIVAYDFAYSPRGTQFLFSNPDNDRIIVANTTGKITERLVTDGAGVGYVAWQPLP